MVRIDKVVRKPYDVVSRDQSVAKASIQEAEDRRILEAMDALVNDPPCDVCKAQRTSEGSKAGCKHCVIREVMTT